MTAPKPDPATGSVPAVVDELRVTVVQAVVKVGRSGAHRVGWLPGSGWCCDCERRRCEHIRAVRDQVQW